MGNKILTVDDSRTIRMIVKRAFQQYDCQIFEAENGMEGLTLAAREKPDLIILDITMPVMTGIEMLAKLKEQDGLKNIPVIMLTAESGKDNVMNIVKMGVSDYIVKPFKGDQLIERARHIIQLKSGSANGNKKAEANPTDCFCVDGDFLIVTLPAKLSRSMLSQVESATHEKISQMNSSWAHKLIVDVSAITNINMNVIQLLTSVFSSCENAKIPSRMVATGDQANTIGGFQETKAVQIESTVDQAKAAI